MSVFKITHLSAEKENVNFTIDFLQPTLHCITRLSCHVLYCSNSCILVTDLPSDWLQKTQSLSQLLVLKLDAHCLFSLFPKFSTRCATSIFLFNLSRTKGFLVAPKMSVETLSPQKMRHCSHASAHTPLLINIVVKVPSFKFWSTHISEDLSWAINTTATVTKAQQQLHFLRTLRRAVTPALDLLPMLTHLQCSDRGHLQCSGVVRSHFCCRHEVTAAGKNNWPKRQRPSTDTDSRSSFHSANLSVPPTGKVLQVRQKKRNSGIGLHLEYGIC